jgi:hypothetical protein
MAKRFRCGHTRAGHDPHFIQVHRARGWQPVTVTAVEGDDITLRLHGGEQRVVRNHDTPALERLLRGGRTTGCWINSSGNLLSVDLGPAQSAMFSVSEDELGECGPGV